MTSSTWVKPASFALLAVSLSACAQSPMQLSGQHPDALPGIQASAVLPLPPAKQELTAQVLYQFLLGEIAAQRGELKLSAEAYADLAGRTRDARVAKRATEAALYARLPQLALKNARFWQELEPSSPKSLQTLSTLLIGAGRMSESKPYLEAWIKAGDGKEVFLQLHGLFARQKDKKAVLQLISDLAKTYPSSAEARFALAQAAWNAGEGTMALSELDEAVRLKPGWAPAPLFKAQIMRQIKGDEATLTFLKEYLVSAQDENDVRLAYAQQLARAGRYADSRAQFEVLAQAMPRNPDVYLSIGLIEMQTNAFDSAESNLSKALELGHSDEAGVRLHLGQLAEMRGQLDKALTWYESINKGPQQFDAQLRVALVMGKQGRVSDALTWLTNISVHDDEGRIRIAQTEAQVMRESGDFQGAVTALTKALEKMPDSADLLYDRAMAAEKINRLDLLEADLQHLIRLKPNHAHAYNALGYTLADRTPRINEALEYLEKALSLAPNDPFILDSMGWALFKSKRYGEAASLLRRALAAKPDPEIAAHLGETLWMMGDKEEARRVWSGSKKDHPDNESLRETTSRLMP